MLTGLNEGVYGGCSEGPQAPWGLGKCERLLGFAYAFSVPTILTSTLLSKVLGTGKCVPTHRDPVQVSCIGQHLLLTDFEGDQRLSVT